jgi:LacI family transcriptional regulator
MSTSGAQFGRPERGKITLEVIARTLGVSTATVSLALRNNPVVAEVTKKRVQKVARELGYIYNRSAAALRTQKSNTLAVAFHDIRNPYFAEMLASLVETVANSGKSILLGSCGDDLDRQASVLETLKEHRPDGVIVCPVAGSNGDSLNHILAAGIPVVQVVRQVEGLDADYVGADDRSGMRQAVDHLVALGHARIGFLGADETTSTGFERLAAYRDGMRAHGLSLDDAFVIDGPHLRDTGSAAIDRLMEHNDRPSAVICASDTVAFGAFHAARRHGLSLPGDLSIVGFDDVDAAAHMHPGLTTVRTHHTAIAREAFGVMSKRIEDPETDRMVRTIAPELMVRGTTSAPGRG